MNINTTKSICSVFAMGMVLFLSGCDNKSTNSASICDKTTCPPGFSKKENNGKCICEIPKNAVTKSGFIKADETWSSSTIYILEGKVVVDKGVTLTIEPGVLIKGVEGTGSTASALVVARDGKLIARGTAQSPIIMTSVLDNIQLGEQAGSNLDENQRGLWGGLIVLGNAPGSFPGDVESFQIEGIAADDAFGLYGGTDPKDSSGELSYISIRHGGVSIGSDNEINGLTLGGVGTGTKIEHIEIVGNQDDGIEFFGGTVQAKYVLVWAQGDDAFDVDQGYSGTMQHFVYIAGAESDHGLEIDGGEGNADRGGFLFEQGTLKLRGGDNSLSKGVEIADFRDGAKGIVRNCIVTNLGSKSDVEIDDVKSMDNYLATPPSLEITGLQLVTTEPESKLFVYDSYKKLKEKEEQGEEVNADDKARLKQQSDDYVQKMTTNNNTVATTPTTGGADINEFSWTLAAKKGVLDF